MGMAEIRDAFEAYASGELAEYELREALRAAVYKEPETVPRYVTMAAALRRRNLISAELEAAVVADMREYAGPSPPSQEPAERWLSPDSDDPTRAHTSARPANDTGVGLASPLHSAPAASAEVWDSRDKLNEAEATVNVGLVLRERFEIVEELGRGGMGVVYKAIDQREVEHSGREPYVAIKVLNEEFKRHPESTRALQRESKKAMRLAHPNIVLVRDFDRDRGNVFMVMELLHGQPLDLLLLQQYPQGMPVEMVCDIVNGLGAALSYAHQQGIVHADFKPSNAFLTTQQVVKVLDFGVARAALALDRGESTLFDAGKLNAVSPAYASVEMLTGGSPDARDDIYALACVTYFLLTARHPYNGIDALKARDARLQPAPIRSLAEHQWQALRAALVFDRWDRTASVREFVARFCTIRSTRVARLTTGASRFAGGASRLASEATRRATNVVRRPSFFAAPLGALLAAAVTLVVVREWSLHRAAAPVVASAAVSASPSVVDASPVEAPQPAVDDLSTRASSPGESARPATFTAPPVSPVSPVSSVSPVSAPAPRPPVVNAAAAERPDSAARLRQQLIEQADGGDIDATARTASMLRTMGASPADLQAAQVRSYARQARQQMLAGNPTVSLQTIANGRRHFNVAELKNLELAYDRVAEELARIALTPSLNLPDHQRWVDEIRQLTGDEFPSVEQLLAGALANDIADQRARGDRAAVVSNLLESGRTLFPDDTAILEHGTAGMQNADQIVVAGEPSDTDAAGAAGRQ
jgi:serine/threonine protein kinase